jgi:hypothetical protein
MKVNPSTGPEGSFNMTIPAMGNSSAAGPLGGRSITHIQTDPIIPNSLLSFAPPNNPQPLTGRASTQ